MYQYKHVGSFDIAYPSFLEQIYNTFRNFRGRQKLDVQERIGTLTWLQYSRRKSYWCTQNTKYKFFQYWDSNKKLFSIAPHRCSYSSSNFAITNFVNPTISLLDFFYWFCILVHGFFTLQLPTYLSLFQLLRSNICHSAFFLLKTLAKS